MKRFSAVVVAVVAVLALAGCSEDGELDSGLGRTNYGWVNLGDGTEVRCVSWKNGYAGGLSCDWGNVRPVGAR